MMRRGVCLGLMVATVAVGIPLRMAHLGLPWVVVKYGGSGLWAVAIYWLVAAIWLRWSSVWVGLVAGVVALAVEVFKLYRSPGMDAFRGTIAGKLLLGRHFSWWDVVAYGVGIGVVVWVDIQVRVLCRSKYRDPSLRSG